MPVIRETENTKSIEEILADTVRHIDMRRVGKRKASKDFFRIRIPEDDMKWIVTGTHDNGEDKYELVPNFFMGWVEIERTDSIYDRGGELVPAIETDSRWKDRDNLEYYRIGNRSKGHGKYIENRGQLMFRIPWEIHMAEDVADLMEVYHNLGFSMGKFNELADNANAKDHGGDITKGLKATPRLRNETAKENPSIANNPLAKVRKKHKQQKEEAERQRQAMRKAIDETLETSMEAALQANGLTHDDIEADEYIASDNDDSQSEDE